MKAVEWAVVRVSPCVLVPEKDPRLALAVTAFNPELLITVDPEAEAPTCSKPASIEVVPTLKLR